MRISRPSTPSLSIAFPFNKQGEGGVLDSAVPVANDGEEYRPETGYQAHNQNEDEDGASTSTESTRDRNSQDERKEGARWGGGVEGMEG